MPAWGAFGNANMAIYLIIGATTIVASYFAGWEHGKSILRKELEELRRSHFP